MCVETLTAAHAAACHFGTVERVSAKWEFVAVEIERRESRLASDATAVCYATVTASFCALYVSL